MCVYSQPADDEDGRAPPSSIFGPEDRSEDPTPLRPSSDPPTFHPRPRRQKNPASSIFGPEDGRTGRGRLSRN